MSEWRWLPMTDEYRRDAPGVVAVVRCYDPGRRWGYAVTTRVGTTAGEGFESADLAQTEADRIAEALHPNAQSGVTP